MHTLILGGTTEANQLTGLLADRRDMLSTLSLAGRTRHPVLPNIACRIGGFGGVEGLADWMREHKVTALVDATHPFAKRMPFNAVQAAKMTNTPIIALLRPGWTPLQEDRWREVSDHHAALATLGDIPQRIFLTVGRLELDAYATAPQHFYLVRTIEPVESKFLPNASWITGRGPFTVEGEHALFKDYRIDALITKNSGGGATSAKLTAARQLQLPVILIARPDKPEIKRIMTASEAFAWIRDIHGLSS